MERLAYSKSLRELVFLVVILSIRFAAIAEVAVQDFDAQIADSETIFIGMVKAGRNGHFNLVVETSLKGEAKPNDEIIVDKNSRLGWRHFSGGGPMKPINDTDFIEQVEQTNWYQKRAVFVGSIKGGKWLSHCYDWTVWPHGFSARNSALKALSFETLVEVIKSRLGDSSATHQVKGANHDPRAGQPPVAPKPLSPVVQPAESMKADEAKRTASASSEEQDSRIPWNIIVIAAVAALGLLWLLLKRRS